MLNVTTSLAFPRERPFFLGTVEQLQRLLRVVTYSFENLPEACSCSLEHIHAGRELCLVKKHRVRHTSSAGIARHHGNPVIDTHEHKGDFKEW
jgi:hypothetical protein